MDQGKDMSVLIVKIKQSHLIKLDFTENIYKSCALKSTNRSKFPNKVNIDNAHI